MSYRGDIRLGATLEFTFTTRRFTTGVPFALAGTPSIEAYQVGSSVPITAGITLTVDYSGVTGLNHVSIVASSGNGFATAKDVSVVIAAGTVDSVSVVGETIGSFSIENRSAVMPTTAGRTLDVTATGAAGIDWNNIENPTTAVNLSGTNIDTDQVVASVTGAVGSVTGAVGSVTGAVGSVTGAVGSVAAGGITAASIAADAITAAKIADGAIDAATFAAGAITATVIADGAIDAATFAAGAITATVIATGAIDADALAADAIAEIADGVWDELLAGHVGAGSAGEALSAAGTAGDPWLATLPGAYGAGTAGSIVGNMVDNILDEAVDGAVTLRESMRLNNSALGAKASGLDTNTAKYRDLADTKDRITATVDEFGNRTAVTRDLT